MAELKLEIIPERLMTRRELALKYDEDEYVISHALKMAGVNPEGKKTVTTHPAATYREIDAASALADLYKRRRDECQQKANRWDLLAKMVYATYEGSYDGHTDGDLPYCEAGK